MKNISKEEIDVKLYQTDTTPTRDLRNSLLFLEYIKEFGFKPEQYKSILELNQSPRTAIIRFLKSYKTFLLSENITLKDLKQYDIEGGYGYIDYRGIVIPSCIINDTIFKKSNCKDKNKKCTYIHPTIKEFGCFISNGVDIKSKNIVRIRKPKYIGFCLDSDDFNRVYNEVDNLEKLRELAKDRYGLDSEIIRDHIDRKEEEPAKELGLIRFK